MTVTADQGRMLAELARACRPTGARRWDTPGILAAIKAIAHWSLAETMVEVATAAADPKANTPAVIGKQGRRWVANVHYVPDVRPGEPRCTWCGKFDDRFHSSDHAFSAPTEVHADPERIKKITDAVRAEIQHTAPPPPTRTLAERVAELPPDPVLEAVRATLREAAHGPGVETAAPVAAEEGR